MADVFASRFLQDYSGGVATTVTPYIRQKARTSNSGTPTAISLAKPSELADGDILVAHIAAGGPATWTPDAAGWTEHASDTTTTGSFRVGLGVWSREVTDAASEPSTYAFSADTGRNVILELLVIRGADLSGSVAESTVTVDEGGGDIAFASVSAASAGDLWLGLAAMRNDGSEYYLPDSLLGVERWETGTADIISAMETLQASGASGARTITQQSGSAQTISVALSIPGGDHDQAFIATHEVTGIDTDTDTHTVNVPANLANGDYLVVVGSVHDDVTVTPPAGFVEVDQSTGFGMWYKLISDAASEPTTYDFGISSAQTGVWLGFGLRQSLGLDQDGGITGGPTASGLTMGSDGVSFLIHDVVGSANEIGAASSVYTMGRHPSLLGAGDVALGFGYWYLDESDATGDRGSSWSSVAQSWQVSFASGTTSPPAPDAPTSPSASTVSSSSIQVDWTVDTDPAPTGHRVERSLNGSTGWTNVSGSLASDADTYTDTGLDPETEYFYRVYAFNASGDSDPTSTVSATTDAAPASGGNQIGGTGAIRRSPIGHRSPSATSR